MSQANSKLCSAYKFAPLLMATSLISTLPTAMAEAGASSSDSTDSSQDNYFAIPAFFMLFRETLEAAIKVISGQDKRALFFLADPS